MSTAVIATNTVACSVILWSTLCAVSRMDRNTYWSVRWSYIVLATGAFAGICAPPDTWTQGVGMIGVAMVMFANRRGKGKCECKGCVGCIKGQLVVFHDRRLHG